MNPKPLFVVAAGSGGHILPALELAKRWHLDNPGQPIIFFTGTSPLEQSIADTQDYISQIKTFSIDTFAVKKVWRYPKITLQVLAAIIKSFYYVIHCRPSQVISTGGLLAIPLSIAARIAGCKVYVHELNVLPGKAVTFLLPWITTLFVCFEKTKHHCRFLGKDFSYKCVYQEYPVRFSLTDKQVSHQEIIANINTLLTVAPYFDHTRITLLLLGGSQGSVGLNTLLKKYVIGHPEMYTRLQIIHQTGAPDRAGWDDFYRSRNIPALTFVFSERIAQYYALADVLISRAGAGSMFEALFFAKQSIIVPLVASSTSHQIDNAVELASVHPTLFTVIDQQEAMRNQALFDQALAQKYPSQPGQ